MAQTDPAYWKTKEGAAFNAISELCNPDASLRERIEAADMLREAFGMPIKHSDDCAIHDSDEPDCTCAYWKEPNVEAATAIAVSVKPDNTTSPKQSGGQG